MPAVLLPDIFGLLEDDFECLTEVGTVEGGFGTGQLPSRKPNDVVEGVGLGRATTAYGGFNALGGLEEFDLPRV